LRVVNRVPKRIVKTVDISVIEKIVEIRKKGKR